MAARTSGWTSVGPGRKNRPNAGGGGTGAVMRWRGRDLRRAPPPRLDRKSTRLNSSHGYISYAVFCLKKKNSRLILGGSLRIASLELPIMPDHPALDRP